MAVIWFVWYGIFVICISLFRGLFFVTGHNSKERLSVLAIGYEGSEGIPI